MRTKIIAAVTVLAVALAFAGCGKTKKAVQDTADAVKNLQDAAEVGKKLENAEEDPEKAVDALMEWSAKMELQEYEKMDTVDAPADFPTELIYKNGKLVESADDSNASEDYISKNVLVKTQDEAKAIREHYKSLLSEAPWSITSQSSESNGGSYDAKNQTTGLSANVDIYTSDSYSKITNIRVTITNS